MELSDKLRKRFKFIKCNLECYNGWFKIIWDLSLQIENILKENNIKKFKVVQIKEKFGGLRYYFEADFGDKEWTILSKVITEAERKALNTCEVCGENGTLCSNAVLLETLCPKCANTVNKENIFIPLNKDKEIQKKYKDMHG